MTELIFPADWDHRSTLAAEVAQVLVAADLSWLQAITELGFVVAQMLPLRVRGLPGDGGPGAGGRSWWRPRAPGSCRGRCIAGPLLAHQHERHVTSGVSSPTSSSLAVTTAVASATASG